MHNTKFSNDGTMAKIILTSYIDAKTRAIVWHTLEGQFYDDKGFRHTLAVEEYSEHYKAIAVMEKLRDNDMEFCAVYQQVNA